MIKVNTDYMEMQAQQMQKLANQLNDISSRVASVNQTLRWNTDITATVRRSLTSCSSAISELDDWASGLAQVLRLAGQQYGDCELAAAQTLGNTGEETQSANQPENKSWWDEMKEKVGNYVNNVKDSFLCGVAEVKDAVCSGVSWLVEEYDKKGLLFKIVNTGAALLKGAGAITSVLLTAALTASTGGAALPLFVLSSIYAGADILDASYDIYHCWSEQGDKDEVGKSVLQDMMVDYFGETAGNIIYQAGDVVYTVTNISSLIDLVKEAGSTALEYFHKGYEDAKEKAAAVQGG